MRAPILVLICATAPLRLCAQASPSTTIPSRDERFTIHSTVLGEDREILVHLPEGWRSGARFDVVYALDGTNLLPVVGGEMEYRAAYQAPPRVVIVGITNNSAEGRWKDFTPVGETPRRAGDPVKGKAADFIKFLETELFPAVAARYPVTRHRTLVGHSLGGLFVLHVLATRPELFEKYIAMSPVIPYAGEQVLTSLAARLPMLRDTISLYTAIGNEREGFPEGLDHLEALLRHSAPASLRWKTERFPTLRHMEMVGPAVSNGVNFVFGNGY